MIRPHPPTKPDRRDYVGMTAEQVARSKAYEALLDAHNEALHDAKWGEDDTVQEGHLLEILGVNPNVTVKSDGEVDISGNPSLPLASAHFWIGDKVEKIEL